MQKKFTQNKLKMAIPNYNEMKDFWIIQSQKEKGQTNKEKPENKHTC